MDDLLFFSKMGSGELNISRDLDELLDEVCDSLPEAKGRPIECNADLGIKEDCAMLRQAFLNLVGQLQCTHVLGNFR